MRLSVRWQVRGKTCMFLFPLLPRSLGSCALASAGCSKIFSTKDWEDLWRGLSAVIRGKFLEIF